MSDPNLKPDDATKSDDPTVPEKKITVKLPDVLGQVTYEYSNLARLACSKTDVRIAFADVTPVGKLVPKFGAVLSPAVAKSLLEALTRIIKTLEQRLGSEIPPHEGLEIVIDAEDLSDQQSDEQG